METKNFTFDYHSGMIRRDLLAEGQKSIYVKKANVNKNNKGLVASVRDLFARK